MELNCSIKSLFLIVVCLSFNCCGVTPSESRVGIIGGRVADNRLLPFVFKVPNCSSSRIGRFVYLTAAHCVWDEKTRAIKPEYEPGRFISIAKYFENGTQVSKFARIIIAEPFSNYRGDYVNQVDIALVTVDIELSQIDFPILAVHQETLFAGQSVTIAGYGCEKAVNEPLKAEAAKGLKIADQQVGEILALDIQLREYREGDIANPLQQNINGRTCLGDSGSPLLVKNSSNGYTVAGVLSYSRGLQSVYKRLDNTGILKWLENRKQIIPPAPVYVDKWACKIADLTFWVGKEDFSGKMYISDLQSHGKSGVYYFKESIEIQLTIAYQGKNYSEQIRLALDEKNRQTNFVGSSSMIPGYFIKVSGSMGEKDQIYFFFLINPLNSVQVLGYGDLLVPLISSVEENPALGSCHL